MRIGNARVGSVGRGSPFIFRLGRNMILRPSLKLKLSWAILQAGDIDTTFIRLSNFDLASFNIKYAGFTLMACGETPPLQGLSLQASRKIYKLLFNIA